MFIEKRKKKNFIYLIPVGIMLIISLICSSEFYGLFNQTVVADSDTWGDVIFWFYIIFPVTSLGISLWYGYKCQTRWKLLIVFVCGLWELITLLIISYDNDVMFYLPMSALSAIPSVFGLAIGHLVYHFQRRDCKQDGQKNS